MTTTPTPDPNPEETRQPDDLLAHEVEETLADPGCRRQCGSDHEGCEQYARPIPV